jgi:hypothetical protein
MKKPTPIRFDSSRRLMRWALLLAFLSAGWVYGEMDLDRVEPVEAGQEIPAADFFRPAMFASPQVNPGGTHVAALSSGGTESMKLGVHELESGDSWLVEGLGNMDVE